MTIKLIAVAAAIAWFIGIVDNRSGSTTLVLLGGMTVIMAIAAMATAQ